MTDVDKRQCDFYYIMTKKIIKHASADVGLILSAYNLRRIFNLIDQNLLKQYLKVLAQYFEILTSLRTFSSASNFAQCFKNYKMGTIIGEKTGGWIVCYGDKVRTKLPITEMPLSISTKKFYTIGSADNDLHGIIPDIEIAAEKALEYTLTKITVEK